MISAFGNPSFHVQDAVGGWGIHQLFPHESRTNYVAPRHWSTTANHRRSPSHAGAPVGEGSVAAFRRGVVGSATTEGVRTALSRIFEGFTLHHWDSSDAPLFLDADLAIQAAGVSFVIEPHVRPHVVEGWHGGFVEGRHGGFIDRHNGYAH
jgi:hypothetical protein